MHLGRRNWHKSPTPSAAALTTFSTGSASFIGRPLVRSALLVGGTSPLASNLTLLFSAHRSKPSTFLACSVHGTLLNVQRVIDPRCPLLTCETPRYGLPNFKVCASC